MRAPAVLGFLFFISTVVADEGMISDREFNEAVSSLGELVAIPSVSNPYSSDYAPNHLQKAATWIKERLQGLGLIVSCPVIEESPPYIFAQYIIDPAKPTLLLYAHYDVQPVDREKWKTDPFIMIEHDGRLFGRGASDDKAGIIAIIAALQSVLSSKKELPVNIKLLFEGEEEYSSIHLGALLEQYSKELQADALIILDGLNRDIYTGTLNSSVRGLINLHLTVHALEKPIHSGIGCLAPDPAQALAGLIYSLRDPKRIPRLLEDCQSLNENERALLANGSQSAESYVKDMGILLQAPLRGDESSSIYERIVTEPSISIVNMKCGQPNGGNSIQDSASCVIGMRLTPGQDPTRVAQILIEYLKEQAAPYHLPIEIVQEGKGAWAWKADLSGHFSQRYLEALTEHFPASSVMPIGGSLPLLREFQKVFPSMEMILPAVEDPQTSAHSHNESQDINVFRNAINSLIAFFYKAD